MNVKKIALFASGSGTNVQNIIEYFADNEIIDVDSVWCNNPKAYVLERAAKSKIDAFVFTREQFYQTNEVLHKLKERNVNLIVLAGFLWLIPVELIKNFTIINIHPALLPKYGGKGMYGMKVHQAVVENKDKESGISVHYVNENYDEGKLIFQARCDVAPEDSPEAVAEKVHKLEYQHFPKVIETVLMENHQEK
ncbi:MAG: phosphoribosylglycinamide formyltransferase [Prolixibacteraceae bacterium]|nr:phosphoribosylglycinamide formyltransferase [Prolixibacteraceae bacterium]